MKTPKRIYSAALFTVTLLISILLSTGSFAAVQAIAANPNQYFTIPDGTRRVPAGFANPADIMVEIAKRAAPAVQGSLQLIQWQMHPSAPQIPPQNYNRSYHFGAWINEPNDNSCLNTRSKVLVRDSKRRVAFKANNNCSVANGLWHDPYTGKQFTSSQDIQIDHLVPLKHAYMAGAFRWDFKTRCLYGNFMANAYHLISVNGHENMSKGDKSPDQYMPPNTQNACGYIQRWLTVKLAWQLVIFPGEARAIQNLIHKYRCNTAQFVMDRNELIRQRTAMSQIPNSCDR